MPVSFHAKFCKQCGSIVKSNPVGPTIRPTRKPGPLRAIAFVVASVAALVVLMAIRGIEFPQMGSPASRDVPTRSNLSHNRSTQFTITVKGEDGMQFQGSYLVLDGAESSSKSVGGTVPQTYTASGSMVSTSFQKKSSTTGILIVSVFRGNEFVKQESTTAPYGVVTLATR